MEARIGWVNATWPFAALSVREEALTVNVGILGRYTFRRDQVVSIDSYVGMIPLLGGGIRIEHTVAEYPRRIVFWCLGPPRSLIKRIHQVGFIPEGQLQGVPCRRGIPARWQTLVIGIALWNLLLLLDEVRSTGYMARSRRTRSSMGGWVLKSRLPKPLLSGLMM